MAGEGLFTLANQQTPQEIRQSIGRAGLEEGLARAQLAPGRGMIALAGEVGGFLKQAFSPETSAEKTAKRQAALNQEIQDKTLSAYLNPEDSVDYYAKLAKIYAKAGAHENAALLSAKSEEMSIARGELRARIAKATADSKGGAKSPIGKLQADLDAALAAGNKQRAMELQVALSNELQNEDSAVTHIVGILEFEKDRLAKINKEREKSGQKPLMFSTVNFSTENQTMLSTLANIPGQVQLMNQIMGEVVNKFREDKKGGSPTVPVPEVNPTPNQTSRTFIRDANGQLIPQ